jgi:hypothetical protein
LIVLSLFSDSNELVAVAAGVGEPVSDERKAVAVETRGGSTLEVPSVEDENRIGLPTSQVFVIGLFSLAGLGEGEMNRIGLPVRQAFEGSSLPKRAELSLEGSIFVFFKESRPAPMSEIERYCLNPEYNKVPFLLISSIPKRQLSVNQKETQ